MVILRFGVIQNISMSTQKRWQPDHGLSNLERWISQLEACNITVIARYTTRVSTHDVFLKRCHNTWMIWYDICYLMHMRNFILRLMLAYLSTGSLNMTTIRVWGTRCLTRWGIRISGSVKLAFSGVSIQ